MTDNKVYMITDTKKNLSGIIENVNETSVNVKWEDDTETTLTNEALNALLETEDYEVEEVEITEETPAQQSIQTHSSADATTSGEADGNPKTKLDWIRSIIGSLADCDYDTLAHIQDGVLGMIGGEGDRAGLGKNAVQNQASIAMKPSNAGVAESVLPKLQKEEQDIIFGETELTEEAKTKITTLFESAVAVRLAEETVKLQEQYEIALEQKVETLSDTLVENINDFLDHVVQEWATENEVAIENSLRTDIAMSLFDSLKEVFLEHNIEIPDDKVDVVEGLVEENKALKEELNKKINEEIEKTKATKLLEKKDAINKLSEGLTIVQKDKLNKLLETVDFEDLEKFTAKAGMIKENFITEKTVAVSNSVIGANSVLTEVLDTEGKTDDVVINPRLKAVLEVMERTVVKD